MVECIYFAYLCSGLEHWYMDHVTAMAKDYISKSECAKEMKTTLT